MRFSVFISLICSLTLSACGDDQREERLRSAGANPTLESLLAIADVEAGARKFRQCAACHNISKGALDTGGPNLYGVFGQEPGQLSKRFSYTAALRSMGGRWDENTLDVWIKDPQKLAPGTKMQFSGVPDALDRADIIAFMRSRRD